MPRRFLITLLAFLLLAACGGEDSSTQSSSASTPGPTRPPTATPGPPSTLRPDQLTATVFVQQATQAAIAQQTAPADATQDCTPGISSAPDADASTALRSGFAGAGVPVDAITTLVTVNREDCDTATVVNAFIQVTIPVDDVNDDETLGNIAAEALFVFVGTALPQPATMTLQFESAADARSFIVNFARAETLVGEGIRGANLTTALDQ